jgi:tetratricopeptide (TPR) repeat protein
MVNRLGNAWFQQAHFNEAVTCYEQALALFEEIADVRGQGQALSNLGAAFTSLGRYDDALDHYRRALKRYRRTGDRRRSDGAATSRHPVRHRCRRPRRESSTCGPPRAGRLRATSRSVTTPAASSAGRRVATTMWSSVLRSARHPQPVHAGATSPKGVFHRLHGAPEGSAASRFRPSRAGLHPVPGSSEEGT